jgi:DNA helicase-2/ATP-dependent DNA helicase PcrA
VVDVANSLMAAEIPELRSAVAMKSQVEATGEIHVAKYADEASEAAAIARQIAQLIKAGCDPREIAVLIRINTMSVALESAFDNVRIPYTVKGSTKFFDRREIKQALLALKVETYSDAKHDLLELITSVCESFGWSQKPPLGSVEAKSAWESLSGLVVMADDLVAKNPQATLQDFMSEIEVRTVSQQEPAAAAVTIATMHAAKGLEWEYVFIPGLVEGVVPYVLALTEHNIAEERRLLYVAITRAKKSVWLSWPNARRGNQGGSSVPSRFLSDINATNSDLEFTEVASISRGAAIEEVEAPTPHFCRLCNRGLTAAAEVAVQRCSFCPSPANASLVAELTLWRDGLAQEMNVLPWLVLTDQTILAIAEFTPQNQEELLSIQGVNPAKAHLFSDELISIIVSFEN